MADLKAETYNPFKAAGGHAGVVVTLTNVSENVCTIEGYSGFGVLDEQGQPVPIEVERGGSWFGDDPGRSLVTLNPGGSAYALLAWESWAHRETASATRSSRPCRSHPPTRRTSSPHRWPPTSAEPRARRRCPGARTPANRRPDQHGVATAATDPAAATPCV